MYTEMFDSQIRALPDTHSLSSLRVPTVSESLMPHPDDQCSSIPLSS